MNKQDLIKSAKKLQQPSGSASKEFSDKLDEIAIKVNQLMLKRMDLDKLIGHDNVEMMKDNHQNFARFMASIFYEYNAETLVETVLWAIRAYKAHGFHLTYWSAELNTFVTVLKNELSHDSYDNIIPFYYWIISNIPACLKLNEENNEQA